MPEWKMDDYPWMILIAKARFPERTVQDWEYAMNRPDDEFEILKAMVHEWKLLHDTNLLVTGGIIPVDVAKVEAEIAQITSDARNKDFIFEHRERQAIAANTLNDFLKSAKEGKFSRKDGAEHD